MNLQAQYYLFVFFHALFFSFLGVFEIRAVPWEFSLFHSMDFVLGFFFEIQAVNIWFGALFFMLYKASIL